MLRSTRNILSFMAIIKPNKPTHNPVTRARKIAQFFKIPLPNDLTPQQISQKYLQFMSSHSAQHQLRKINYLHFLQANSQHSIIEYTKQQISHQYREITPECQNAMDTFFLYCLRLYNDLMGSEKPIGKHHPLWKELTECVIAVNQFFPLLTPKVGACMLFSWSLSNVKYNIGDINHQIFQANYRICYDSMINIPIEHYSFTNLIMIFKNISTLNINFYYHHNAIKIISYFWQGLKNTWYKDLQHLKNILIAIHKLGFYTEDMLNTVEKMLQGSTGKNPSQNLPHFEITLLLNLLIKCKRINENTYQKDLYRKIVIDCVGKFKSKPIQKSFYKQSIQLFYQAGLWLPEFWLAAFDFIERDQDNTIEFYKLYVLNRLLELQKDKIPPQIIKASKPLKKVLEKNKNFHEQLIKDFNEKQTQTKSLSCQVQIANSLRMINLGSIRTEHMIQFFQVDIAMDNNFVIEVNGATHYLLNLETGHKEYNLKTVFRTRTLGELGYRVIDVDLEDFAEGSFEVIEGIYETVKGSLKYKQFLKDKQQKQKKNDKKAIFKKNQPKKANQIN